jgi:hypothetical protein
MNIYKSVYVFMIFLYIIILIIYVNRFVISYNMTNYNPTIIENRSLTFKEHQDKDKAEMIRKNITKLVLTSSFMVFLLSIIAILLFKGLNINPKILYLVILFSILTFFTIVISKNIHL